MNSALRLALMLALCWGAETRADIVLLGSQHIGDEEIPSFTPTDPVTRAQMIANPTRFHLSQPVTITAVRFTNAMAQIPTLSSVQIDGLERIGTLVGSRYDFALPVSLTSGVHTIAPDAGCISVLPLPSACPGLGGENDVSSSSIVLVTSGDLTTTSRALTRRRHIGDDNEAANDNYGGDYYPDVLDTLPSNDRAEISFSLDAPRVLNFLQFYRLRGVNTPGPSAHAQVLVNGVLAGLLANGGDPFQITTALPLAAGPHTLSVIAGSLGAGNVDSISWDDIILLFSQPTGGVAGRFNAVDTGLDAVSGVIGTKISGAPFSLDIVALDLAGNAQLTDYAGTVNVELLDASNDNGGLDSFGCRSTWTLVQSLGSVLYDGSNLGRRPLAISYPSALRRARIRITDTLTSITGCSSDAFAIRPADLEVLVSNSTPAEAGIDVLLNDISAIGSGQTHRAGNPFTVRANARNALGAPIGTYGGSPVLSVQSTFQGAIAGTLNAGNWTGIGTRRTDTAQYTEAGTFNMVARDAEFAEVDILDSSDALREIVGTVGVGRFTPDHFQQVSRVEPEFIPACSSFTYVGQSFVFGIAPELVIEAVNAAGVRTRNYTGILNKMPTPVGRSTYSAINAATAVGVSLDTALVPSPDRTLSDVGDGSLRLVYIGAPQLATARGAPVGAFNLEVQLDVPPLTDSDGVPYTDAANPLRFGALSPGNGITFSGGFKQQRWGKLFVRNAYGSELQPLDVPYGVEYLSGATTGYSVNLADNCTLPAVPTLTGVLEPSTSVVSTSSPVLAGQGTIRLAAPNAVGSVTVNLGGASWLLPDTDADAAYDDPAKGTATFGQFRQGDRQIYLRETYR